MPLTVLRRGKPTPPRLRSLSRAHSYKETRVDVCLYVYGVGVGRRGTTRGPFTQVRAWKVPSVVYMQPRKEALTRKLKKELFFKKCVPRNERMLPQGRCAIRSPRNGPRRDHTRYSISDPSGRRFGRRSRFWSSDARLGRPNSKLRRRSERPRRVLGETLSHASTFRRRATPRVVASSTDSPNCPCSTMCECDFFS
ncbi:unnamed protein product [Ixodes pacificus]